MHSFDYPRAYDTMRAVTLADGHCVISDIVMKAFSIIIEEKQGKNDKRVWAVYGRVEYKIQNKHLV